MQKGYTYVLSERPGKKFDPKFRPQLSPAKMLRMGIFEGKYLNDCRGEFPKEWYTSAKRHLSRAGPDPSLNALRIKSRMSLGEWRANGWIIGNDPRGWFQWYCRYWLGRREPAVDAKQIARWRSFARHRGQILASYRKKGAVIPKTKHEMRQHRPKQRQALLQWAYYPWI
jgi:hypothetical protein